MTGGTSGAGFAYPFGSPNFIVSCGVRVAQSLIFCVVFCRSLFVLLPFLIWPLSVCLFKFMASDDPFGKFLYLQNFLIKDKIQTFALTMNHADKAYTSMVPNSIQIHFILRLSKSNEQIM